MAKTKGTVVVVEDNCKGCELCVVACPVSVLAKSANVNNKGYNYAYMANSDACIGCGACALICPDSVLTVYKIV